MGAKGFEGGEGYGEGMDDFVVAGARLSDKKILWIYSSKNN